MAREKMVPVELPPSELTGIPVEHTQNHEQENQRSGMFFGGFGASLERLRGVASKMKERFGDKYKIFNSKKILTSEQKLAGVSNQIRDEVQEGKHVTLVGHSLGGVVAVKALAGTEDEHEGFLEENAENISLRLISPATFNKNFFEGMKYLGRYAKLSAKEMARVPFMKNGTHRKFVSLSTVQPDAEILDTVRLNEGLRKAFPEYSEYKKFREEEVRDYMPTRDYREELPVSTKAAVDAIDRGIAGLLRHPEQNKKAIKSALRKRVKLTHKVIEKAYKGEFSDKYGDPEAESTDKWNGKAITGFMNIVNDAFFNPKILKQLTEIRDKGIDVQVYVPEYDLTLSVDEVKHAIRFPQVRVVPGTQHTSPWAVQPDSVAAALRDEPHPNLRLVSGKHAPHRTQEPLRVAA